MLTLYFAYGILALSPKERVTMFHKNLIVKVNNCSCNFKNFNLAKL